MDINSLTLRAVSPKDLSNLTSPSQKIKTDDDIEHWRTTRSYHDYAIFLRRLSESVVGYFLPWSPVTTSEAVRKTLNLLDQLDHWIEEIPPLKTPQRFGNLAFRTWGQRLDERSDAILGQFLGEEYTQVLPHIKPYFLSSFGSFTRMDYGTGHETSFALFLLSLTLVRFFDPEPDEERNLVLSVFLRYLRLCWKLQDTYRLEPAGSHGVWGLDDYSFLPYIFGSGELRDQAEISVSSVLHPPLLDTNLYFMAVMRIHDVKYGPFHEHSSQLHSIALGVANWSKVNSGLFKMYEAEVLGKRVVVQHIPLGGLLEWEEGPGSIASGSHVHPGNATPGTSHGYAPSRHPAAAYIPSSAPSPTSVVPMGPPPSMPTRRPMSTNIFANSSARKPGPS